MRKTALSPSEKARRYRFQRVVKSAIDGLPGSIQQRLDNVAIVIEEEPTIDQLAGHDPDAGELFGLYEGTPLIDRTSAYSMALPDKITIFRGPLERSCATPREMEQEIRVTVLHELAHHLGFDEDAIEQMGLA